MKLLWIIASLGLLMSCGQETESDLSAVAKFTFKVGSKATFLKRSLDTDTSDPEGRVSEWCTLYENGEYQIYGPGEHAGAHTLVNVVGYNQKGCGFSKGYVYNDHIVSFSHTPKNKPVDTVFPLTHRPYGEYVKNGVRKFSAARSGGRLHAATDLYSSVGSPVIAMDDGEILDYYYFYSGTYAIVVKHNFPWGTRIVRYGEVQWDANLHSRVQTYGSVSVKKGQVIGGVGKLRCNCEPMLHVELFGGNSGLGLTVSSNDAQKFPRGSIQRDFRRRGDLLNPTQMVLDLEKSTFGL